MATTPIGRIPELIAAREMYEAQEFAANQPIEARRIRSLMRQDVERVAKVLFAGLGGEQGLGEIVVLCFGGSNYEGEIQERDGSIDVGGAFRADLRFLLQDDGRIHQLQVAIPYVTNEGRSKYGRSPLKLAGETITPPHECTPLQTWESLTAAVREFMRETTLSLLKPGVMASTADVEGTIRRLSRSNRGREWVGRVNGAVLRYSTPYDLAFGLEAQHVADRSAPLNVAPSAGD